MSQLDLTGQVVPFQYGDTAVRTVLVAGEPWFVLADLCRVLDLSAVGRVASRLDEGVRSTHTLQTGGGAQQMTVVSEAGMYEVVIRSDKAEAAIFRRWITGTVLPEIRRTGSFGAPAALDPAEEMARGLLAAQRLLTEKNERIAELEPKAVVADKFLDADGDLSVRDAAQALTRAGVGVGQNRLFTLLDRKYHWIGRGQSDNRYRAMQTAIETGYVSVLPQSHYHPRTGVLVLDPPQIRVTPKGMQRILLDHNTEMSAVLV